MAPAEDDQETVAVVPEAEQEPVTDAGGRGMVTAGAVTVRLKVVEWETPPPDAVTVIGKVPSVAGAPIELEAMSFSGSEQVGVQSA